MVDKDGDNDNRKLSIFKLYKIISLHVGNKNCVKINLLVFWSAPLTKTRPEDSGYEIASKLSRCLRSFWSAPEHHQPEKTKS